ncbi:glycerol-3-phosphate 1-O-acyltransferase PlsY [Alphaproteobacteria bacterium KMM 3653]|uniref:Glycerol-3-phosphate acyltransferase n=1 Tax=Harenicola maris TaxID=2841044 RepID=A0AAP2CQ22_9RHOB|nr:glycerol-3-phosphate 1-O-acyltransferase PlsY [Harenicola maris]
MPMIDTSIFLLGLIGIAGYLLGSVSGGMVMSRVFNLGDLRAVGSGNIGATNVLRTGNKKAALLTLIIDGGKGVAAVLLGRLIAGEDAAQIAGLCAFLGHLFPVFLAFRGGKGVATFLGIMLGLNFWVGLGCCATWLVVAAATRFSSLSALIAAAVSPLWMLVFGYGSGLLLALVLTVLVYFSHRANIVRLKAGTEPKIGQKKTEPE